MPPATAAAAPEPLGPAETAEATPVGPQRPATPAPPRPAELKATNASGSFGVFDGPVDDAKNARRPAQDAPKASAGKGGKKVGGKKAVEEEPPVDPVEAHRKRLTEAKGLIRMWDSHQRAGVRERYVDILPPEQLEQLDSQLKLTDREMDELADPIAEGMEELGVELPWWARAGLVLLMLTSSRRAVLASLERQYQEHLKKQQAAKAP